MQAESPPVRATLLGTGTSTGVPVIGCSCRVCTSDDPRDRRLRCACFVETNGLNLLIDAGPDFRTQALRAGIRQIDTLLVTHHHFDHVAGLDDLRPFFFDNKTPVTCYTHPDSATTLRKMYWYIFEDGSYPGIAKLELAEVTSPFHVTGRYNPSNSVLVTPIEAFHADMPVLGFRIGSFAYLTDTNRIPPESMEKLRNLDVLVLDALRRQPHRSHFTIPQAIEVAQQISAKKTIFTHMTHTVLYEEENDRLPEGISLGYDGLVIETN